MRLRIYRYDPERDAEPYLQAFQVEPSGPMLLDALEGLKEEADPSLTFRRSCREGVCGSDGMNINGRNGLACITPIEELREPVTLRPLPGQPVVKDLVVDLTRFYEQYRSVQPYLKNDEPRPEHERLQSPEERAQLDGLYECILCACCSTACPSYWWNPDRFLGPAALLQAFRFINDSRDTGEGQRLDELDDAFKLFRCRTIMNCAEVCPKGLNPTAAIGEIKKALYKRQI
ncbi:succinate dehydrogenase iron-sulfur subunit [Thiohalorhabdus sp.]|uniref:succinate dehydrogenase iron-sulfur subunit n=1 Tax=Thiohalorhabdus sp. TaxID=3094134 RepID=UPI002FC3AF12